MSQANWKLKDETAKKEFFLLNFIVRFIKFVCQKKAESLQFISTKQKVPGKRIRQEDSEDKSGKFGWKFSSVQP